MTCDGCANQVKKVLGKLGGKRNICFVIITSGNLYFFYPDKVTNLDINVPEQIVKVTTTLPKEEILENIKKTGKSCEISE